MKAPQWHKKLTKYQLKHVEETTEHGRLWEVRGNVLTQEANPVPCWDCIAIGRRLGIEVEAKAFHESLPEGGIRQCKSG